MIDLFEMKEIGIIGFGNQAKAWALNLRDSGYDVSIYLRKDSGSFELAQELDFRTKFIGQELPEHCAILTPDETHLQILEHIKHQQNKVIIYAHGYSMHYNRVAQKYSQFDHLLCAPKAIASELRWQYETHGPLGGVYSCEYSTDQSTHRSFLKRFGTDLGLSMFFEASIEHETKADLLSEQSLLCSTIPYAILGSYNELRKRGISKEVSFFETWHEFKLITDTFIRLGPEKFFNLISPNALLGSQIGKETLFSKQYLNNLETLYNNIENKQFVNLVNETNFNELRESVLSFWKDQELTNTFNQMKDGLYP